jgi:cytochrome c553
MASSSAKSIQLVADSVVGCRNMRKSTRIVRWLIVVSGLVVVASACGGASTGEGEPISLPAETTTVPTTSLPAETTTVPTTSRASFELGDPARGRELWDTGAGLMTLTCSDCHSLDGTENETSSYVSPSWLGISEVADSRVPGLSAKEYLWESIVDPGAYIVDGYTDDMPKSFALLLSEEDIASLVAFILTQ